MRVFEEKEELQQDEIFSMLKDTSRLYTNIFVTNQVNHLTNDVEFWKWLKDNYPRNFSSTETVQAQALNNTEWFKLQLQGKGYEWDFITSKREEFKNLFSRFDAGVNPTQKGIDITEANIITGEVKNTYQNKAYYGKSNPNLKNTPKDTIVVTNSEKVKYVQNKGYETEKFLTAEQGSKIRNQRFKDAIDGKVSLDYNLKNIGITMGKAGISGLVIGMGIETISSYRKWKNNLITTDEYLKEILISGGEASLNAIGTAGLMIPVTAKITALGISKFINFPVAIVISVGLNKIIAPAFGRGKYKEYLSEVKYYQQIDYFYKDFIEKNILLKQEYEKFILNIISQEKKFNALETENNILNNKISEKNSELEDLIKKISGGV